MERERVTKRARRKKGMQILVIYIRDAGGKRDTSIMRYIARIFIARVRRRGVYSKTAYKVLNNALRRLLPYMLLMYILVYSTGL